MNDSETPTRQKIDMFFPLETRLSFLWPAFRQLEEKLFDPNTKHLTLGLFAADNIIMGTDLALALFDLIKTKPSQVTLTTYAMSSMVETNLLIWLCGDKRILRREAWVHFYPSMVGERINRDKPSAHRPRDRRGQGGDFEIEDARVVELITRHIPLEMAGRRLFWPELSEWLDVSPSRRDDYSPCVDTTEQPAEVDGDSDGGDDSQPIPF